jgi:hypothetical protein
MEVSLICFPKKTILTYRTLDLNTDVKRKHVSVFHFCFIATNGNKNKKAIKTSNEFGLNTLVDHLERKTTFTIQYTSYTNFLETYLKTKHDEALSAYETNDVVRMMIEITILMLNMSTSIMNNHTNFTNNNMFAEMWPYSKILEFSLEFHFS